MRRRYDAGMTLLEVIIAITLVSLLSAALLFAMRAGLTAMGSTNRAIEAGRRVVGAERILQMQLAGFLPAMVHCGVTEGALTPKAPFLQGEPMVMRFVTAYSILGGTRGLPQIVEIFAAPASSGFRLLANEIPYRGPVGAGRFCGLPAPDPETGQMRPVFPIPQPNPGSFVIADRLGAIRFSYLESLPQAPFERWLPRWTRADGWPAAIMIEMLPAPGAGRGLPGIPVVIPIRVNRPPQEPYEY